MRWDWRARMRERVRKLKRMNKASRISMVYSDDISCICMCLHCLCECSFSFIVIIDAVFIVVVVVVGRRHVHMWKLFVNCDSSVSISWMEVTGRKCAWLLKETTIRYVYLSRSPFGCLAHISIHFAPHTAAK